MRYSLGMKYLLIAILLVGCAPQVTPEAGRAVSVDPAFRSYVTAFEKAATEQGRPLTVDSLTVEFGQVLPANQGDTISRGGIAGHPAKCEAGTIVIDARSWDAANASQREMILFHEMGHCVLGRDHTTSPDSLMYPTLGDSTVYEQYRQVFLEELFRR